MVLPVERHRLTPALDISRVLVGLWQIADMERRQPVDAEGATRALAAYVDAGLTTFDMADHYGSAEQIVGRFIERHANRDGVQVLTKWVPKPRRLTRADVRAAVDRSLLRLRIDTIDVLQFHAWNYADPSWLDCLSWLEDLRAEGKVRSVGVTNVDTAHLRIAVHSGIRLVSNQVCYSLLDQRPRNRMAAFCREHGIALLAYGTLAGGLLTERWLNRPEPDRQALGTWSEMKYARFIDVAGGWSALQGLLLAVHAVALRNGVSMANVAARYILDQPTVGGVIIGARLGQREHISDNLRVFTTSLAAEDRLEIETALGALEAIPGDCGDEYRRPPFLTASGDLSHHVEEVPPPYPVESRPEGRDVVLTGTEWEAVAGYCRALRRGNRIWISGTTATHGGRVIGGSDAAAQMHFVVDRIEGALQSLGARLADVVRTRVYVRRLSDWEAVARAHGERFREVQPANTLVQAGIVGDEYLVEADAEAEL
jgi:aryl-alcohol dehydrogenase-like predicted oxidoreductase/enamine deaminase RidA (YjgF/YER057c/UK114 family)